MSQDSLRRDNLTLLFELNSKLIVKNIPGIILATVIAAIGTIGNVTVLHTYYFKFRRSAAWYCNFTLAMYDVVICSVLMPINIQYALFTLLALDEGLCKFYRSLNGSLVVGSMWILCSMALVSYVKVCHPFRTINIRAVKVMCALSLLLTLPIHLPFAFLLFGVSREKTSIVGVTAYICFNAEEARGTIVELIYMIIRKIIFFIIIISFIIFYGLMAKRIKKEKKIRKDAKISNDRRAEVNSCQQQKFGNDTLESPLESQQETSSDVDSETGDSSSAVGSVTGDSSSAVGSVTRDSPAVGSVTSPKDVILLQQKTDPAQESPAARGQQTVAGDLNKCTAEKERETATTAGPQTTRSGPRKPSPGRQIVSEPQAPHEVHAPHTACTCCRPAEKTQPGSAVTSGIQKSSTTPTKAGSDDLNIGAHDLSTVGTRRNLTNDTEGANKVDTVIEPGASSAVNDGGMQTAVESHPTNSTQVPCWKHAHSTPAVPLQLAVHSKSNTTGTPTVHTVQFTKQPNDSLRPYTFLEPIKKLKNRVNTNSEVCNENLFSFLFLREIPDTCPHAHVAYPINDGEADSESNESFNLTTESKGPIPPDSHNKSNNMNTSDAQATVRDPAKKSRAMPESHAADPSTGGEADAKSRGKANVRFKARSGGDTREVKASPLFTRTADAPKRSDLKDPSEMPKQSSVVSTKAQGDSDPKIRYLDNTSMAMLANCIMFVLCNLPPLVVVHAGYLYDVRNLSVHAVSLFVFLFVYVPSAAHPIIYVIFSTRFRTHLKKQFHL